ncbi:MAG: RNA polymerase-binding protein DksA [Gammaproteobacteria bacterium]|nr:RNA polymerase-binding protein DksA [Gammaproteobacteria bacterium]
MAAKKKPVKKTTAKTTPVKKTAVTKKVAAPKAAAKPVSKKTPAKITAKPTAKTAKPVAKPVAQKVAPIKIAPTPIATQKKPSVSKDTIATTKTVEKKPSATSSVKRKTGARANGSNDVSQLIDFTPYEIKKGEDYMNKTQYEHFRQILLNWQRSLMEEVDRTVGHMKDDAMNFPDPNDRATQEEEFSLELRARDRERKLIKKIEESITAINSEEYGYCNACGIEIGIRRLEARPTASMCIDCKTLDEMKEKQTRA